MASTLKLTYFNGAGRAHVTRVCLGLAGIEFEDERISFQDLVAGRGEAGRSDRFPLGALPVLTLPSGKVITQSSAIARYVAKLAKLYPEDAEKALLVDEIIDTCNDCITGAPQNPDPEVKKKLREEFAAGKLKVFYSFLADKLSGSTGAYSTGTELTVADIQLYTLLKSLRSGNFDHIASDYDATWPVFESFINTMESNATFAPYKL